MSDTFLTEEEVAELSGIRSGRNGQSREARQALWLRTVGIPFWVNARGRPIVARVAIEGRYRGEEPPKKKWQPRLTAMG
ncbi:hypothetical protein PMO31116_04099 [Pandoraea morbifera]|uniref:DUF4224 domain-containing protein n=1 Tax=Pandoraea morbifera TaxID=2508300 RepID=A0A5E4XWZ2_9BURK|nr:DUF4224 domain-containing protein [Pandoraea morbifera]VVE40578.1 hypothetical protein PMO31116_04099 [Pandoraea morbifera]